LQYSIALIDKHYQADKLILKFISVEVYPLFL